MLLLTVKATAYRLSYVFSKRMYAWIVTYCCLAVENERCYCIKSCFLWVTSYDTQKMNINETTLVSL